MIIYSWIYKQHTWGGGIHVCTCMCVCKCGVKMYVCVYIHMHCVCVCALILKAQLPYKVNTSGILNEEKRISVTE